MNYQKPIIRINNEIAEGVYAASGETVSTPDCDSQYMNGIYQAPQYGWNTTVMNYYGCLGCPANTNNTGCALDPNNHFDQSGNATSYEADAGSRMPAWESLGLSPDQVIDDNHPQPY